LLVLVAEVGIMTDGALKTGLATARRAESLGEDPESLLNTTTPAFVTDAAGHVILWNRAIERLFDRPRKEALGRHCYDLLRGRDVFGNRFCHESCAVRCMTRRGEPVRGFELVVGVRSRPEQTLKVTVLAVSGRDPEERRLVHLLTPVERERREAPEVAPPQNGGAAASPLLTPRENDVLRCVAAGLQNKEVARELGISVATARNHVHNILQKLEVHSKLEAISLAFRQGWVPRREP
jgi:DNA-binding CsgD family transcriptional regulator